MDCKACVIVGLPQNTIVTTEIEKGTKPRYDTETGARVADMPYEIEHYFIASKEVDSVFDALFDEGLEMVRVAAVEEDVWGIIVAQTGDQFDNEKPYVELDPFELLKAKEKAERIFDEMGIKTKPKTYLVLSGDY